MSVPATLGRVWWLPHPAPSTLHLDRETMLRAPKRGSGAPGRSSEHWGGRGRTPSAGVAEFVINRLVLEVFILAAPSPPNGAAVAAMRHVFSCARAPVQPAQAIKQRL